MESTHDKELIDVKCGRKEVENLHYDEIKSIIDHLCTTWILLDVFFPFLP